MTAEPWASVTIDGKLAARETPLRSFTLPAGRHTVVLTNPTYGTKTVEIDVPVDGDVHKFVDITAP